MTLLTLLHEHLFKSANSVCISVQYERCNAPGDGLL